MQVMKHLNEFRPHRPGALQAYLRQALMNRIRDELRRAARSPVPTELPEALQAGRAVAAGAGDRPRKARAL